VREKGGKEKKGIFGTTTKQTKQTFEIFICVFFVRFGI
jgi:hypothetical protein